VSNRPNGAVVYQPGQAQRRPG